MGLDYSIQYKKGKENQTADALSRCHEEGEAAAITMVVPKWCSEVVNSYDGDEHITDILEKVAVGSSEVGDYALKEGLLRYKGRIVVGNKAELKKNILQSLHKSPMGGHSAIQNTYLWVKQLFYWPQFKRVAKEYVLSCDICRKCKHENVAYSGLLQPLQIPEQPWLSLSMDFIEGLPRSEGKDCVLVVVDRLTKFAHFAGLSHHYTVQEVARVFMD